MSYTEQNFKIPQESDDYAESSAFAIQSIEEIIENAILQGQNKIIINTNLKLGLPMENINKIAGPFGLTKSLQMLLKTLKINGI